MFTFFLLVLAISCCFAKDGFDYIDASNSILSKGQDYFVDAFNKMSPAWRSASETVKKWVDNVSGRVVLEGTSSICDTYSCCQISSDNSCSISTMPEGETTMVLAPEGSDATCIFGTQYGIQVIPGASEKLLFYFQGGGACWDKASTVAGLCTTEISPNANAGVFDKGNDDNPFKDYTIVHALYCSGDVYSGNVTQGYKYQGNPVIQKGVANARFAINWAMEQAFGGSDGTLENLVVMGCSAGSIGAQMWADILLSSFPAKTVAVVPDSYAGLFPEDSVGPLMKSYGVCDTELIDSALKPSCYAGSLDIQHVVESHIASYKRSPFAFIQSKVDAVQQSFYVAVGLTTRGESAVITPASFYAGINGIFTEYNKLPNFITYLVDGPMHCFTNMDVLYKATNAGPEGKRHVKEPGRGDLSLRDWLAQLPLSLGQNISTECVGDLKNSEKLQRATKGAEVKAYTYCDSSLIPKTFVQNS